MTSCKHMVFTTFLLTYFRPIILVETLQTARSSIINKSYSKSISSNNSACDDDICDATFPCLNNGTCYVNSVTCQAACLCERNFTGSRCEAALFKQGVLHCGASGVVCANGVCKNSTSGYICECYQNWAGKMCDINTDADDDNNVTISLDALTAKINRVFSARRKNQSESFKLTSLGNRKRSQNSVEAILKTKLEEPFAEQVYNVCMESYEQRSLDERRCSKYFETITCHHGVCKKDIVTTGNVQGYKFICQCDPGAYGPFCEKTCCLDCGVHGKCDAIDIDGNLTEVCNCRYGYTGDACEELVPEPVRVKVHEATWYLWIVGLCGVTFVLLVTAGVLAPYMMWKHRVILVMKIVHYFQPYEDEDNKEYDAFVSYKADEIDERFVVKVLYPKLEKELGFKLCLHFRDFVPGEAIANNIINAVEGSRRTILILTPRYVQSEFTRFEYQKAQAEMLKRKHRIIPIMLEDITHLKPSLDENLKGIIGSVTYLEWPDLACPKKMDKFWKRLQLSMPKKKESETYMMSSSNIQSSFPTVPSIKYSTLDKKCLTDSETLRKVSRSPRRFVRSNIPAVTSYCDKLSSDPLRNSETPSVENVYVEIGDIDESVCEIIRPLSEEEEMTLAINRDVRKNEHVLENNNSVVVATELPNDYSEVADKGTNG